MKSLRDRPVMVVQAEALGMIGVIRSLGRAGLNVHAVSEKPDALGLRSNFVNHSVVCPPMRHAEFSGWLEDYCRTHDIQTIMPTEGLMLSLGERVKAFSSLLPISVDPEKIVLAYSKARTQLLYQQKGLLEKTPPGLVFTRETFKQQADEIASLSLTVYVKADAVDTLPNCEVGSVVTPANSYPQALNLVEQLLERFSYVQVQGNVSGKGAGVNCLRWNGDYRATFVNYCDHETPHTGGLSTLRRSWDCPAMLDDAHKRLDALDWQGVAMVEYKVDPDTGDFYCVEINARFWAALHLALYAGADFPLYLAAAHAGVDVPIPRTWRQVSSCYDVPGEVAHVSSMIKDSNVSKIEKLTRLATFFSHYVNPNVKFDLNFPGDRKLYFINLARFCGLRI